MECKTIISRRLKQLDGLTRPPYLRHIYATGGEVPAVQRGYKQYSLINFSTGNTICITSTCRFIHGWHVGAPRRTRGIYGHGYDSWSRQGTVVLTCVPLSPGSIAWYRPKCSARERGKEDITGLAESNGQQPIQPGYDFGHLRVDRRGLGSAREPLRSRLI